MKRNESGIPNVDLQNENMKLCFVMSSTHRTKYEMEMRRQVNITPPKEFFTHCREQNWPEFVKLCREEPQNCKWISPYGQNLLHFMCQRLPSVESIVTILRIAPDALMKEDIDGCLPIHMAMTNSAPHDVLSLLIQAAPDSVKVKNKWGYTPYEWIFSRCLYELLTLNEASGSDAVTKNIVWHTIKVLIKALSRKEEKNERTILHMTTEFDCPVAVLEAIIKEFPWMIVARDKYGRVPLASAAGAPESSVSNELLQFLVSVAPQTLLEKDKDGRIPLHLAIDHKLKWSSIKFMVLSSPDSVRVRDDHTNLFPFMLLSSKPWASLNDLNEVLSVCLDFFEMTSGSVQNSFW